METISVCRIRDLLRRRILNHDRIIGIVAFATFSSWVCLFVPLAGHSFTMLHYFKFRQELFDPAPAKEIYQKRPAGRGWPEECPPIRAANSFGFDLLANFDVTFVQTSGQWRVLKDVQLESDFDWASTEDAQGRPLTQQYAWFWEKGQKIPHPITDNVYREISNQVKISTFLFLQSDANEILYIT